MSMTKYDAFLKVASCKSISKAAGELGYTQSAISKMIFELEKEWDLTLFIRNHNGITLTSEGKALIPDVKRLLNAEEHLNDTVLSLHGIEGGHIRLGAPFSISANIMPGALKDFQQRYPYTKVDLTEGEDNYIADLLKRGEIDICILPTPLADMFDAQTLLSDPLVAVLPKDNKYAKAKTFPLKAFDTEEMIQVKEISDFDIRRFLKDNSLNTNTVYEVSDFNVMLSMVEKGLGFCVDYELLLKPLRYDVVVKPLEKTQKRVLKLCVRKGDPVTPIVEIFKKDFKEYIKKTHR